MKVNNSFLSKIIKEEIKSVVYNERFESGTEPYSVPSKQPLLPNAQEEQNNRLKLKLINLFKSYREKLMDDPTSNQELVVHFHKLLKRISPNLKGPEILNFLDGAADLQLLSFISDLIKRDPDMSHGGYSLPSYEMPAELSRGQSVMPYNRGQLDAFQRAPQQKGPYEDEEQIDFRRNQKNLTKENNMKLTKEFLKELIKESLQEAAQDPGSKLSPDEIQRRREAAFAGMEDKPAPGKSFASTIPPEAAPAAQGLEKRKPLKPNVQKLSAIYNDAWTQLNKVKSDLDVLVKNMAEAGRMLKVQLEENKEEDEK